MSSNTFHAFNLHPKLQANITALSYKTPTPIQQKSIPAVLSGHDLMGLAQTGTGKTAAFLLPLLQRLIEGPQGHVRALILAPTRELAQQIHEAFGLLAKDLNFRSVPLYGGVSIQPQKDKLRRGVDVVIACPGRLLDHIRQRSVNLSKIEMLVLDEADHMFDVGFLPDVRKILQQLPKQRQSLLFSATMPQEVRQLANEILTNPTTVQIDHTNPVTTITQALYPVPQSLKNKLLLKLLEVQHIYSVLIFTRTKQRAQTLAEQLEEAGYSTTSLQGNLSQKKRERALRDFKSGKLQILVATDIAARGIDVASLSHVINYDMPDTVAAYTHRIGRTGRAAKTGDAFTLITKEDAFKLRNLERVLGKKLEQRILPDFDYKTTGSKDALQVRYADGAPKKQYGRFNKDDAPQKQRGRFNKDGAPQKQRGRFSKDDAPQKQYGRFNKDDAPQKQRGRFSKDDAPQKPRGRFGKDDAPQKQHGRFSKDDAPKKQHDRFNKPAQKYKNTNASNQTPDPNKRTKKRHFSAPSEYTIGNHEGQKPPHRKTRNPQSDQTNKTEKRFKESPKFKEQRPSGIKRRPAKPSSFRGKPGPKRSKR